MAAIDFSDIRAAIDERRARQNTECTACRHRSLEHASGDATDNARLGIQNHCYTPGCRCARRYEALAFNV